MIPPGEPAHVAMDMLLSACCTAAHFSARSCAPGSPDTEPLGH
jgi:hypothetical protein